MPCRRPLIACHERLPPLIGDRDDHVTLHGLHFGPTPDTTHAVVLYGASAVTLEDCVFEDVGGLALVETVTARWLCDENTILRSRATAMYFGCLSGSARSASS